MGRSAPADTALGRLTDQVIAFDLLNNAKAGVKMYAAALTASTTPAIRNILKKQLDQEIAFQEQAAAFVSERGWYNAYDAGEQLKADDELTRSTLSLLR